MIALKFQAFFGILFTLYILAYKENLSIERKTDGCGVSSKTRQTFPIKYAAFYRLIIFSLLARGPRHPFEALATSEIRVFVSFVFFLSRCRAPKHWAKRRTALLSLLPELFRLVDRMHTPCASLVHLDKLIWQRKVYANTISYRRAIFEALVMEYPARLETISAANLFL